MFSDEQMGKFAGRLVGESYVRLGVEATRREQRLMKALVEHRKIPEEGWDDHLIEQFVNECARLDSNNYAGNCGAGEREARIACGIVKRRHFTMGHGIGRSGDIGAVQPKAAGSSIVYKIAIDLVLDLLKRGLGMNNMKGVLLVPMATGMSLSLVMQCMRHTEPKRRQIVDENGAVNLFRLKYVLWCRIDQATCLKSIKTAGFVPIVVETKVEKDVVKTDLENLTRIIQDKGPENILCVLSTTSCFAPRVPDDVVSIAKICKTFDIGHVINNAYGLQCSKCCHLVNEACKVGTVNAIVQSTDKNLMVPVGGAIISGPDKTFIEKTLSTSYPGRASMSPIMDVFLTLMSLGMQGYLGLRKERIALTKKFLEGAEAVASKHGERVLPTSKENTISFAITLSKLGNEDATKFGSMLFRRGVSGARVVSPGMTKTVADIQFENYGASAKEFPCPYFTVACAIGLTEGELNLTLARVDKTFDELYSKQVVK